MPTKAMGKDVAAELYDLSEYVEKKNQDIVEKIPQMRVNARNAIKVNVNL